MIDIPFMLFDAGPLIHLSELSIFAILDDYSNKITTRIVLDESKPFLKHDELEYIKKNFKIYNVQLKDIQSKIGMLSSIYSLDYGEITALSIALKFYNDKEIIFVSDDSAARIASDNLNIKSVGTIGLIIKSVTRQILKPEEALSIFNSIPEKSSLYIKQNLLNQIVQRLKTEWGI